MLSSCSSSPPVSVDSPAGLSPASLPALASLVGEEAECSAQACCSPCSPTSNPQTNPQSFAHSSSPSGSDSSPLFPLSLSAFASSVKREVFEVEFGVGFEAGFEDFVVKFWDCFQCFQSSQS